MAKARGFTGAVDKNGCEVLDCKTNTKFKADAHYYSCSLLWDMVKECGINE